MTEKERNAYYRYRMRGSGNMLSFAVDRALFLLLVFLMFLLLWYTHPLRLILSILSAVCASALSVLYYRVKLARFMRLESDRIRRLLFVEQLMLAEEEQILPALYTAAGRPCFLLRSTMPVTLDAFLCAYRDARFSDCCFMTADADTETAHFLSVRLPQIILYQADETYRLLCDLFPVSESAVDAYIVQFLERRRKRRRSPRKLPRGMEASGKYLLAGLMLLLLSFFARYALYYRLLSGLALSLAGITAAVVWTRNRRHENAPL